MGKFVYEASAVGLLAVYVIDGVRNIITINVKDEATRLTIQFSEIHVNGGSGYSRTVMWREANKGEFESIKFMEQCEVIAQNFENYIKNFSSNSNW